MFRLYLVFIFGVTCLYCKSQSLPSFLFEDVVWGYYGCYSPNNLKLHAYYESSYFDGAYTKNGKEYHLLHFFRGFFDNSDDNIAKIWPDGYDTVDSEGQIGVREEGNRIYVNLEDYLSLMSDDSQWRWAGNKNYLHYWKTEDGELILYDFNLQIGDKYPSMDGHGEISVVDIENISTLDGVQRRLFILSNGLKIMEGFGCMNSPGLWLFYLNHGDEPFEAAYLSIYGIKTTGSTKITPIYEWAYTPSLVSSLKLRVPECTTLYDLTGRNVTKAYSMGVYIQNGRKVVVR